jgi:hypothetical protein
MSDECPTGTLVTRSSVLLFLSPELVTQGVDKDVDEDRHDG